MYLRLSLGIALCSSVLLSCSKNQEDAASQNVFFNGLYKSESLNSANKDIVNGVWNTKWRNNDGYLVNEFISIDKNGKSFLCVLNPMGGYEYSPVKFQADKIFASFIDSKKDVYINQLGEYGRSSQEIQLNYVPSSDTLEWSSQHEKSLRKYSYTRLSPSDKKNTDLFNDTCAKLNQVNVKTDDLKIEKLSYNEANPFISVLQTSKQGGEHTNYCVFNTQTQSVLSIPVKKFSDYSVAFSNLDILSSQDHLNLFQSISTQEISSRISSELLSACSAVSQNVLNQKESDLFQLTSHALKKNSIESMSTEPSSRVPLRMDTASTYLVCKYRNAENGSNEGWEWGEYPRWEWEKQKSTCSGLFASNCIHLTGEWARNDSGVAAMGTMFVIDSDSEIEADFSRACRETNKLQAKDDIREYAQYHVADSSLSFNHTIWFKKTRQNMPYNLPFNRIISFGDSLSDNGNLHGATGGIIGAGAYYQGRFSNGPVWVEHLSQKSELDLYDWAVADATSDLGSIFDIFKTIPYTLQSELTGFSNAITDIGITQDELSKTLFTVLFGANNFAHNVKGTPEEVSDDFVNFVSDIVALGARHIMVVNLPDLSLAPKFKFDSKASDIHEKIIENNRLMAEKLNVYQRSHPEVTFYNIDLFKITEDAVLNPIKYNLTNTEESCYLGGITGEYESLYVCNTPESYLFWDNLHPSTTFACKMANITLNSIFEQLAMPHVGVDYDYCSPSYIH